VGEREPVIQAIEISLNIPRYTLCDPLKSEDREQAMIQDMLQTLEVFLHKHRIGGHKNLSSPGASRLDRESVF
jgi:hypothetical protein